MPPAGTLPRADADSTSTAPRATEWLAGAKPNCRNRRTASDGTAHATAAPRDLAPARARMISTTAKTAAATTHIHALVEVTQASAARSAATFIRPRTA